MSTHSQRTRGESTPRSSIRTGRFGRMFRWLPPAYTIGDEAGLTAVRAAMRALAETMSDGEFLGKGPDEMLDVALTESSPRDNPAIPSGYTYLGQFIDHDLTFDPISVLQALNDPDALEDYRTPRFDLDSLYGRGPEDQPYLYLHKSNDRALDGVGLAQGRLHPLDGLSRFDIPRLDSDLPLIGDVRNDDNRIVGQIHTLFSAFHNKVAREILRNPVGDATNPAKAFAEITRRIRWHYQWIILHDFLPRIACRGIVESLRANFEARDPRPRFFDPKSGNAYMPVEFSGAAFRFGHSMVRTSYSLNMGVTKGTSRRFHRIPIFLPDDVSGNSGANPAGDLAGGTPLPPGWGADWRFFFEGLGNPDPGLKLPQPSHRIDTKLTGALNAVPLAGGHVGQLALLNLRKGLALQLPSGEDVAAAMGFEPLSAEEIWEGREDLIREHPLLRDRTPLWFYILREAELDKEGSGYANEQKEGGHCLGDVGSTIVAEVLLGLAWNDHHSYLYQAPRWKPDLVRNGRFRMTELIQYVDGN